MGNELGDHNRELILSGLDEDIKLEEDSEEEKGDRGKWVLVEEAEMEREVVDEAVRVAIAVEERERAAIVRWGLEDGGAGEGSSGGGGGVEEGPVGD